MWPALKRVSLGMLIISAPSRVSNRGVVYFAPEPGAELCMGGLFDGLRDGGFIRGQNLQVHEVHAQGEIANIPALLQNNDNQGLDLIVVLSTPCFTAACGAVKHTPVVFTYVYGPIAAGVGESFTQHYPKAHDSIPTHTIPIAY